MTYSLHRMSRRRLNDRLRGYLWGQKPIFPSILACSICEIELTVSDRSCSAAPSTRLPFKLTSGQISNRSLHVSNNCSLTGRLL